MTAKRILTIFLILVMLSFAFLAYESIQTKELNSEIEVLSSAVWKEEERTQKLNKEIEDIILEISAYDEKAILQRDAIWIEQNKKLSSYMH